ncbi:hypothetical protein [Streptomyces sp. NBC_01003]|uniref:hypothetical protein n=1 Tax=Streptomyces sp. NBC_01003 TaxID=2903714 RepID=UPI00387099BD
MIEFIRRRFACSIAANTYRRVGAPAGDHVAVPAQYRGRSHQQSHPAEHLPWQAVEERRQESPVACMGMSLLSVQLPFQNADLVAQGQDLDNLLMVTQPHRSQHCGRVRRTQVRQSQ